MTRLVVGFILDGGAVGKKAPMSGVLVPVRCDINNYNYYIV